MSTREYKSVDVVYTLNNIPLDLEAVRARRALCQQDVQLLEVAR